VETTGRIEVFKVPPAVVDMIFQLIVLMYCMTEQLPQLLLFLLQLMLFCPFVMLFGYILMHSPLWVIFICSHLYQKVREFGQTLSFRLSFAHSKSGAAAA
jgi:hypothetical protein